MPAAAAEWGYMRLEWNDEQNQLYESYDNLGEKLLSQDVAEREKAGVLSRSDWRLCAENGVQRLIIPSEYGGDGCGPVTYARAMEGLGHGCSDNGLLMSLGAHILAVEVPIWQFGNERQRRTYLPELGAGRLIGGHAITEADAGSDALAVRTTAERDGAAYRITGAKRYVTNAPLADVFIVYATVDPALGFTGVTAFLVQRDDPGVAVRTGNEKMGLRTAPWGDVELDGCRIPADRRLGAEKQGSSILARTMMWERTLLLAPWLGVLHREIDECFRHCRQRRQFGRVIGQFQSMSNRLVDMWMRLELARMLVHRAAAELAADRSGVFPEMAKLYTSEAAVEIFTSAVQVYGALGYTADGRVERNLRDAIGITISSGTSDIQRMIMAGRLGISLPG